MTNLLSQPWQLTGWRDDARHAISEKKIRIVLSSYSPEQTAQETSRPDPQPDQTTNRMTSWSAQ